MTEYPAIKDMITNQNIIHRKLWHDETPGEQTESGNRCRQNKQKVSFSLLILKMILKLKKKMCSLTKRFHC